MSIDNPAPPTVVGGVRVDNEALRVMPLNPMGHRDPALEGTPFESSRRFFDDGVTFAGVWECTPGRFAVAKRGSHSVMYILDGDATVTGSDGQAHELSAGVVLVEPDGWDGEWDIRRTIRKLYVITRNVAAEEPVR